MREGPSDKRRATEPSDQGTTLRSDGRVDERERRSELLAAARQGGLNFSGALFNQALRFTITFMIARILGPDGAGLYYQSFALLAFIGLLASGGFTFTLTRYVAVHRADRDEGALRGTVRLALGAATLTACAIGVALFQGAPWLARIAFEDDRMVPLLRLVAIALPATVYTDAALSATRGFKTMKAYARINLFFEPACRVALTLVLLWRGWGLSGVMLALVATNLAAAGLSAIALRRLMGAPSARPRYEIRQIFTFSTVTWFSNLASSGLLWTDTILLGVLGTPSQVGVYQVATRLTLLATVFLQPVTNSFAPRIADLWHRGRHEVLRDIYVYVTSWIFRLSLPSFVVLIVFPEQLLTLFGPEFRSGASVTVILSVAWIINSLSGPGGYMLTMSGRAKTQMVNNVATLFFNVGLNVWLIPKLGILGAAISWGMALVVSNVARAAEVWAFSRILPFNRSLLKGLWAGLAAALFALGIRYVASGATSLVVGIPAVGLVYLAVLAALGIDNDDRMILCTLRRRLRVHRVKWSGRS